MVLMYIDPGSGALIWQLILSSLFGVAFYYRRIITWVTARAFQRGRRKSDEPLALEVSKGQEQIESETVDGGEGD
jgi:hypothetical protein